MQNKIMEVTTEKLCDDHVVRVRGLMHLLISGHFDSKYLLYQTLEDVYHNFTSIHKAAVALTDTRLGIKVGGLLTFCRCSLKRILEEDGITINRSLADLLAEIELYLLDLANDCTHHNFLSKDIEERICKAYCEPSPIYCYHLIISPDLMIEFLHQQTIRPHEHWVKHFIFLTTYLKLLTSDRIHCDDKFLIAVENVAYKMSRYVYVAGYNPVEFNIESRVGILKALVLQANVPIMSDAFLVEYVDYVKQNIVGLQWPCPIASYSSIDLTDTLKCQLWVLYEGVLYLMHLLITYLPSHSSEQHKLSNTTRLDFQSFVRDVGYAVVLCLESPEIEEISLEFFDLFQKFDFLKGEIVKTVCCIVLRESEKEPPKRDQLGSMILLLKNLKEFMDRKPSSIITWKDHENLVLFIFYLIQNNIRGSDCTGDAEFSQNSLHIDVDMINHEELNGVLVSSQVVAFNMAGSSLLRRRGRFLWWELYMLTEKKLDMHMYVYVGILKAIVLSITSPLTDELLIAHGEFVQDSLSDLQCLEAFDPLKGQFEILLKWLPFLGRFLLCYRDEQEKLSHIRAGFQELVSSVGSVICSSINSMMNGDTKMQQSNTELSNLLRKMNLMTIEAKEFLYLVNIKKIGRESPKTNQLGALNSIVENWNELVECESDLIITWKEQFQMIHKRLVLLKSFIESSSSGGDESQNLCSSIVDAGHVAEYLLSTFSFGTVPVQCTSLWISQFMKHVDLLAAAVVEVNEKISTTRKKRSNVSVHALLVPVPSSTDVEVGFKVEMDLIRDRLTGHLKELDVISIIGMPGLGKTTLARKAYEDRYSINRFDVRAWCCVSQEYDKKQLLLTILGSISKLTGEIRRQKESELSVMLHKKLTGRRYFVVLDDIWDINAFSYLKCFFPDDNNGSRGMLTSRSKVIGSLAQCRRHSNLIEPDVLTDEQSWDLLEQKVYNKGKCPSELCQIGKEIAMKCRGLPLAVVVVGGVLAKGTQTRDFWEQVLGNLSSHLARNAQTQFVASLELSYEYLPDFLKPMFLYFGMFPEDKEISAKKLMRIWMAEGFVQKMESSSLEGQAETNLMDLIDRSLVMVAKKRWDGRVKACHVHDLLRDMCIEKAKEENFMQQVRVNSELTHPVMYQRRLSIILERDDTTKRHLAAYADLPNFSITPPIYTLLFFYVGSEYTPEQPSLLGIEPLIASLKLLKVFDAEIFELAGHVLDKDLTMLVRLKYVSFQTYMLKSISLGISRLQNLETLIIKNEWGTTDVPETIWEMTKLRHLHINKFAKFSSVPENSFVLENLQTLSTFVIDAGGEKKIFKKIPCLKKLGCSLQIKDQDTQQFQLPDFESLDKLESLNMIFEIRTPMWKLASQLKLKLPLTLKKLKISGSSCLRWSQIAIFKTLSNLEFLQLSDYAANDEVWDMGDDDVFTNLKFLKLEKPYDLKIWSASSVNFPRLEKLVLKECWKLEEIPSDLGEINTLQMIEVIYCSSSLEKQVKDIQKEQEELGNESLKFHFYHPNWV